MADDNTNQILGTVILGGIALKILDSDSHEHNKTVTKTVYVNKKTGKPVKTVTKKTKSSPQHGPFYMGGLKF